MKLVSTSEAAKRLGVHPKTIARLVRLGKLAAVKVANRWVVEESMVEAYGKSYVGKKGRPKGWSPKREARQ